MPQTIRIHWTVPGNFPETSLSPGPLSTTGRELFISFRYVCFSRVPADVMCRAKTVRSACDRCAARDRYYYQYTTDTDQSY